MSKLQNIMRLPESYRASGKKEQNVERPHEPKNIITR